MDKFQLRDCPSAIWSLWNVFFKFILDLQVLSHLTPQAFEEQNVLNTGVHASEWW
jgi:hypothetical protein